VFRYFSLALKNSLRNPRRSFLTVSSVAMSLCLLGVLIAIYNALFYGQETPGQALRLIVRHRVSLAQAIPASYEQKVRQLPGVVEISPWNWFGGTYKDSRDTKNFFARMVVLAQALLKISSELQMTAVLPRDCHTYMAGCMLSHIHS